MDNGGSYPIERHFFLEKVTLIKDTSVQCPFIVRFSAWNQMHPYSVEIAGDS